MTCRIRELRGTCANGAHPAGRRAIHEAGREAGYGRCASTAPTRRRSQAGAGRDRRQHLPDRDRVRRHHLHVHVTRPRRSHPRSRPHPHPPAGRAHLLGATVRGGRRLRGCSPAHPSPRRGAPNHGIPVTPFDLRSLRSLRFALRTAAGGERWRQCRAGRRSIAVSEGVNLGPSATNLARSETPGRSFVPMKNRPIPPAIPPMIAIISMTLRLSADIANIVPTLHG